MAVTSPSNQQTFGLHNDGGAVTELELLRRLYDEICDIRRKHADIIADTANKKAENQRRLKEQTSKLERLEAEHRETGRRLTEATSGGNDDDLVSLQAKHKAERYDLEALRRVIDDLEFEMFEADARFDDEKESIQQQLMAKQQELIDIENQYRVPDSPLPPLPVKTKSLLVTSDVTESRVVAGTDVTTDPSHVPHKEHDLSKNKAGTDEIVTVLHRRNADNTECSCYCYCQSNDDSSSPSRYIQSLPSTLQPLPDCLPTSTTASRDRLECSPGGSTSSQTASASRSVTSPRDVIGDNSVSGGVVDSDDEFSTTSSERILDRRDDPVKSEKSRMMRIEAQSDDEGLREETQQRVRRRLDVDFDVGHTDDSCLRTTTVVALNNNNKDDNDDQSRTLTKDDDIRRQRSRRSGQSRQSRPLTRYLPVRDEPLDLLRFVEEQAGHSVEACKNDVIVASQSARGFLIKMGGRIRTWRRRWFVFDRRKRHLAYYVSQSESKRPRGVINFSVIEDVFVFDQAGSVKSPVPELTFCIKTSKRTYHIVAPSTEVRQLWMDIIFTGAEGYKQFS